MQVIFTRMIRSVMDSNFLRTLTARFRPVLAQKGALA